MEPPFFRAHYGTPTPPPYNRRDSVRMRTVPTQTSPSYPRKVVSIPVHFMDSGKKRSEAALKIQKTFRGFRVRKTVNKILELKREVDAVEKRLQDRETMAVIKRDGMERLKVNETLMGLLFKLDSIQGFNYGVREFRKAVIRKAIMLQELIDSAIDDGACTTEERDCEETGDNLEAYADENDDAVREVLDESNKMCVDNPEEVADERLRAINSEETNDTTLEKSQENDEDSDDATSNLEDSSKIQIENPENFKKEETADETLEKAEEIMKEVTEAGNSMQAETFSSAETWECIPEETEAQKLDFLKAGEEDAENHEDEGHLAKRSFNDDWYVVDGGEERDRREKLLEKMAEDNQKLMALMADMCQKNATQTRMICSLSQRVEQLEKAMSDRLRRKKKKSNAHI